MRFRVLLDCVSNRLFRSSHSSVFSLVSLLLSFLFFSADSRHYGPVPLKAVTAKVLFEIFPSPGPPPRLPQAELDRLLIGRLRT